MQKWIEVCPVERIVPDTGVCALVNDEQVAIFRIAATSQLFAVGNHDPFSDANVISRGIVGDKNGKPKVASPIYKQNFCLQTGECLDDPTVKLRIYPVRCENGQVLIGV